MLSTTTILPLQVLNAQNATTTTSSDQVSGDVIVNLAKPGYGNKYDVALKGNTVPISYNIPQGSLVGILADPSRHSVDIAVNPSPSGGALKIDLPRNLID